MSSLMPPPLHYSEVSQNEGYFFFGGGLHNENQNVLGVKIGFPILANYCSPPGLPIKPKPVNSEP